MLATAGFRGVKHEITLRWRLGDLLERLGRDVLQLSSVSCPLSPVLCPLPSVPTAPPIAQLMEPSPAALSSCQVLPPTSDGHPGKTGPGVRLLPGKQGPSGALGCPGITPPPPPPSFCYLHCYPPRQRGRAAEAANVCAHALGAPLQLGSAVRGSGGGDSEAPLSITRTTLLRLQGS